jgi:hypothetical protein
VKIGGYRKKAREIRILVAFESDYRAYRDVLAAGIRILRPHSKVETAELETLDEEVKRFEPQVLICSLPEPVNSGGWAAWVELSKDLTRPTRISIGGHYSEWTNPTLEDLLGIIDKVEEFL